VAEVERIAGPKVYKLVTGVAALGLEQPRELVLRPRRASGSRPLRLYAAVDAIRRAAAHVLSDGSDASLAGRGLTPGSLLGWSACGAGSR
jgi:hypothetical protein